MVILHIANVKAGYLGGVSIVVPQHIFAQQFIETVGFVNVAGDAVLGVNNQFEYDKAFSIQKLPEPFNHPNIVVFHEVYYVDFLRISSELRKTNIPYIIVPHGGLSKKAQQKKMLKKKVANWLLFNKYIFGSRAVQCLSQNECNNITMNCNKFIATNGVVIPQEKKEAFCSEGIKMLYIGRLEVEIKGIDLMISAVKRIENFMRENRCKVYIYGPDELGEHEQIQQIITTNGLEDVVCLGDALIGDSKKQEILSADYFIQTSRTEGMPIGILEAMGYGLPCIVTMGTGLDRMIEENGAGWGCETSVSGIARAIERAILEKDMLSNKSQNARNLIQSKFDWKKVALSTVESYKRIIIL